MKPVAHKIKTALQDIYPNLLGIGLSAILFATISFFYPRMTPEEAKEGIDSFSTTQIFRAMKAGSFVAVADASIERMIEPNANIVVAFDILAACGKLSNVQTTGSAYIHTSQNGKAYLEPANAANRGPALLAAKTCGDWLSSEDLANLTQVYYVSNNQKMIGQLKQSGVNPTYIGVAPGWPTSMANKIVD